jgi:N-sulfoglucosamine sulfohydrolase
MAYGAAIASAGVAGASSHEGDHRPNILLIVSEDNGPELGCYGEPHVRTPVLDHMAAQGVRFAQAYVAQPGCSPSRGALLTGLYPHQNGQIGLATWEFEMFREDIPNIVRSLNAAGYRTGIIGKLHVNPASAFPFDFVKIPSANFGRKNSEHYAEEASNFFVQGDAPFFLSINYPDAHRPFHRQLDGRPAKPLDDEGIKPLKYIGLDSPKLRTETRDYYNCMARLDELVGDLLAKLEASGKAGNTLVVYIGDHGADLLRGKRTPYEGGIKVPMIASWPGLMQSGQVREEMVSLIDLVPTFLEVAQAEPIEGLPGRSLLPMIRGEDVASRDYLFTEYHVHSAHNYYPQRTVRDDRFKLILNLLPDEVNPGYDFAVNRFYGAEEIDAALAEAPEEVQDAYKLMRRPPEFELYDLQEDPYEFRNLAEDSAHSAKLTELKKALLDWRRKTNDPFLEHENVLRLQAEIAAIYIDGEYSDQRGPWGYIKYMAPGNDGGGV